MDRSPRADSITAKSRQKTAVTEMVTITVDQTWMSLVGNEDPSQSRMMSGHPRKSNARMLRPRPVGHRQDAKRSTSSQCRADQDDPRPRSTMMTTITSATETQAPLQPWRRRDLTSQNGDSESRAKPERRTTRLRLQVAQKHLAQHRCLQHAPTSRAIVNGSGSAIETASGIVTGTGTGTETAGIVGTAGTAHEKRIAIEIVRGTGATRIGTVNVAIGHQERRCADQAQRTALPPAAPGGAPCRLRG